MKVSELAEELGVPTSTVLAQCQRFAIGASWSGAELNGTDVVILRAELADVDAPIDLTGSSDEAPRRDAVAVGSASSADASASDASDSSERLPPTAVGSLPDLIEEVTPEPEPEQDVDAVTSAGGFRMAGSADGQPDGEPSEQRRIPPRPAPERKHLERLARNSAVAFFVALAAFAGSNYVGNAWVVAVLWLLCAFALIVAVVDGIRGSRRISTHPDRLSGRTLAAGSVVLAGVAMVGLGFATYVAVREEPVADAPSIMGDLDSVASARWGAQRLQLVADNGWHSPVKQAGTCWAETDGDPRDVDRTEFGNDRISCGGAHSLEVVDVFALNQDIDAPYPDQEDFVAAAVARCGSFLDDAGEGARLLTEFPGPDGWADGDHDVACVVRTVPRRGSLLDAE